MLEHLLLEYNATQLYIAVTMIVKDKKKECFKLKYLVKESVRQVVDVVGP